MRAIANTTNHDFELATILAACDDPTGTLSSIRPKRCGYFRGHLIDGESVFIAFAPADTSVTPIAAILDLNMTIGDAIAALGPDGVAAAKWLLNSLARS